MKTEVARSYEASVSYCNTTLRQNTEDLDMKKQINSEKKHSYVTIPANGMHSASCYKSDWSYTSICFTKRREVTNFV
jgi:hypothetical protein